MDKPSANASHDLPDGLPNQVPRRPCRSPRFPWEVDDPAIPQAGDLPLSDPPRTPPADLFGGQFRM